VQQEAPDELDRLERHQLGARAALVAVDAMWDYPSETRLGKV